MTVRAPHLALAALLAGLAAAAGVTWFVLEPLRDALLPALLAPQRPGLAGLLGLAWSAIGPLQWLLLAAAGACAAAVLALEWRRAALSALLAGPAGPMLAALAGVTLWLGHSYLGHGVLLSGDTIAHVSMLATRIDGAITGQGGDWSNWKYLGLPLQQFYAPSMFWPLLRLALLTGDMTAALRGFLFAAHAASGLAGYALARQLGLGRRAAGAAGLVYAGSFAHLHLVLYRGALPQALSAVLLPLALLFVHRVAAGPQLRRYDFAGLALAAGLLLVNYTPLAIVAAVHMAVLAVAALAGAVLPPRQRWRRLGVLAAAGLAAGGLAAVVLVPAALAGSEVLPVSLARLLTWRVPDLGYAGQLLVWRAWRTDYPGGAAYLGLVPVALALWGGFAGWRGARPGRRMTAVLAGLLALSTVLSGLHVRDVLLTVLYVALLAGIGAERAMARGRHAPAIVLGLLLLDLGSTAVQPVGRTDKGWMEAAGAYLAQQERVRPSRTLPLEVMDGRVAASAGPSLLDWHPAEFVAGGHVEMATPAWVGAEEAGYLVESDLAATGRVQRDTQALLCLLRVGRVVGVGRTAMGLPATVADTAEEGPLGRVLRPGCTYDVVWAPALVPAAEPRFDPTLDYTPRHGAIVAPAYRAWLGRLLQQMMLTEAGTAALLAIPGLPAPISSAPVAAPVRPVATVAYAVRQAAVDLVLDVPAPGFVRLGHAWHARLVLRRDGQVAETWRDATGCVVVAVPAGRTRLTLSPGPSWPLRTGAAASVATLLGLVLLLVTRRA